MTPAAIDFETFYDSKDGYSIREMSTWQYIHDNRFNAYWVGIHADDLHYSGPVASAPWAKLVGRPLVSHNSSFDEPILNYLQETGAIPCLNTPSMFDTIDAAAYFQEPRALDKAAKSMLGIEHSKAVRARMDGVKFGDLGTEMLAQMTAYGGADAELCWKIWEKTHEIWPLKEQQISLMNRQRGWEGLRLDVDALNAGIAVLQDASFNLLKAMPWVPDRKPLSPEAIREQGRKDGIPVPASLKLDDPAAMAWEIEYSPTFRWVSAVRGFRRVNSLLKKLQTWASRVRPDGTAPFQLKYFGAAATGRFSGAGGFNLQNLPKKPAVVCKSCWCCLLEDVEEGIEDEYEVETPCPVCGSTERHAIDLRGMILAPEGHSLVIADYDQIEARLLLWRVGDEDTLKLIRGGMNLYEAHARRTMGWTGGVLKEQKDPAAKRVYFLAKCRVLGLGYGCSYNRFRTLAKTMAGIDLSLEESKATVFGYRDDNPRIPAHWRWHHQWLSVSAIKGDPTHEVQLASGRTVRYFNPRFDTRGEGESREIIAETVKNDRTSTRKFYGGKLTENEIQATARDAMCDGVVAVHPTIKTLFTVHDELVTCVPSDQARDAKRTLEEVLPKASEWAKGCPLGVTVVISDRYLK